MTNTLTVVAKIIAQADKVELVKAEMEKLIAPTLLDEGCLQYDLHQDNADPAVFIFYEQWQNEACLQAHLNTAHIARYMQAVDGAVVSFELQRMTKL